MSHYVLIPGAGGTDWYWHRVVPLLEDAGHTAIAIDLPGDDESAGLPEYVEFGLAACAYEEDIVIVAQSLGGFTAAMLADRLVAAHRPPRELVMVNAMVPSPGETPGAWWEAVGQLEARVAAATAGGWPVEFDIDAYFLHDVDPDVAQSGADKQRPEADVVFGSVCDIAAWPAVSTRVIAGDADRFFPLALQQRVARERLGLEVEVLPGGHLIALSQPDALVAALVSS
ncbi:MAG: alpha/beta hydrolase [Marmoricola sp.]|nr:alpha/beta hydrolase [Marmoricola sp.]